MILADRNWPIELADRTGRWNWPVMLALDAGRWCRLAGLERIGVGERTAARWDLKPSGPMAAKAAAHVPADAEAIAP